MLLNLRCQTRTRVAEKRPASHTDALGSLFIADEWENAQHFFQGYGSLGSWYGRMRWQQVGFRQCLRVWNAIVSFAPPGLVESSWVCPRLAPWAAFFRSFGAGRERGGAAWFFSGIPPAGVMFITAFSMQRRKNQSWVTTSASLLDRGSREAAEECSPRR